MVKPVAWRWCERPHDIWRVTNVKPFERAGRLIEPLYSHPAQASGWRPIETAPKDGTQIIGLWWSNNSVAEPPMKHIGICVWAGAWIPHQRKLTHWHPVPQASSVSSAQCECPVGMHSIGCKNR